MAITVDSLEHVRYSVEDRVATITLHRPERFNAISARMPDEIACAVDAADEDARVHVMVVRGAGRGFCGGYDLKDYAERRGTNQGVQDMPWDPTIDFRFMDRCSRNFLRLWRCHKPTIAVVHGDAVAGGSDIALSCDLVLMADEARIGYPPARVWGVPSTGMWVHRVGAQNAKRMMFTGDLIYGPEAAAMGLALESAPRSALDDRVRFYVDRMRGVPRNQLMMTKMVVNQAIELQGLEQSQRLSTLFDGIARHTPEGMGFKERAEQVGYKQAVAERDSGAPIPGAKDAPEAGDQALGE